MEIPWTEAPYNVEISFLLDDRCWFKFADSGWTANIFTNLSLCKVLDDRCWLNFQLVDGRITYSPTFHYVSLTRLIKGRTTLYSPCTSTQTRKRRGLEWDNSLWMGDIRKHLICNCLHGCRSNTDRWHAVTKASCSLANNHARSMSLPSSCGIAQHFPPEQSWMVTNRRGDAIGPLCTTWAHRPISPSRGAPCSLGPLFSIV